MLLPVREVEHEAQVVPRQNARQTGAELERVGRLYVRIWIFVYAELRLAPWVYKQSLDRGLDMAQ
jgi:hypothetical protein